MVWELRLLGFPILYLRAEAVEHADDLTEWNGSTRTNGSFERDTEPLSAIPEEPYYEDRRIGFR